MKSKTIGYFLLSIIVSIITLFLLVWMVQPSDNVEILLVLG